MIINNTYFKADIYLPHAKPNASDGVVEVENEVLDFINEYARDCLFKSLGSVLFYEFIAELDPLQTNGLKVGSVAKWNDLLNGKSYTDSQGNAVVWRGIRYKSIDSLDDPDRSFLANYVYFHYESNDFITRSDAGTQREQARNAEMVMPTQKVVKAWRKFIKQVQGSVITPKTHVERYGFAVDYYGGGDEEVSLYRFINDSNDLVEDTYEGFNPKSWEDINQFGI